MTAQKHSTVIPTPRLHIGSRIVLPLILIGGASAILIWSSWRAWAPLTTVGGTPVVVRTSHTAAPAPGSRARGSVVQAPGWIEPAPFALSVPALIPGVVREVLVLEGDSVTQGQVVARLVDDQAVLALRRAEAELQVKVAELAALEDELTRKSTLVEIGGVSAAEVARLGLRVSAARATHAQFAVARDESALALARTEVRAPAAGVVMARLATTGSFVGMGPENAAVVQLFDPASLQVRTDVPLADAGQLAIGQSAEIQVDALPGVVIKGRVVRLVQQADIAKNTLQAKVLLESPPAGLVPDMLARVRIELSSPHDSNGGTAANALASGGRGELAIPEAVVANWAVSPDGTRTGTVRVVINLRDEVGTIEERAIVCLGRAGPEDWTTVVDGLRPGDFVVSAESPPTRQGQTVRVASIASSQPTGAHNEHR